MQEQSYANHRQLVPAYHVVLLGILVLTLIGSLVNLYKSFGDHERLYNAALIVVLVVTSLMIALFCRVFSLKTTAWDRPGVRRSAALAIVLPHTPRPRPEAGCPPGGD